MPNMFGSDIRRACGYLLFPWRWFSLQKGKYPEAVAAWLKDTLQLPYALPMDSGRSALYFSLKAMGISKGDEVLVQAYTCLVVINAIRWTGATPIYLDVSEVDSNIDPTDIERKITSKTKAIIIQHTFGIPAHLDAILPIARRHGIKTIEDCAHSLNVTYNGKQTGTFADAAIFSFGGEKVVSCVRGGAMVTADEEIYQRMQDLCDTLPQTPRRQVIRHLLKYPVFVLSKFVYSIGVGKVVMAICRRFSITSSIISVEEKRGDKPPLYPARFPNALAHILLGQLEKITFIQQQRNSNATYYRSHLPGDDIVHPYIDDSVCYLRYVVQVANREELLARAKTQGIILGTWYKTVVDPLLQFPGSCEYMPGSCPRAERLAGGSMNLPIHLSMTRKDQDRVIASLQ